MRVTTPAPRRPHRPAPPVALRLRGVVVRFQGLTAVDVEEMIVREGRIVGLIGPNGAGKTTLFDAISGHVEVERGSIELGETVELHRMSPSRRARHGLGRSFQNATLFEGMTVAETLAVAYERRLVGQGVIAGALRLPWSIRPERLVRGDVDALAALMGLGDYQDKFIAELSTGTRRIVDLACVVAHHPSVLLLDEPSSGIAQREVEVLENVLRQVKDALGCTMLVVEHDIPLIRSLSDELYAMEVGRVCAHGTPAEVVSDPEVVRSYLGTDSRAVERSGVAQAATAGLRLSASPTRPTPEALLVDAASPTSPAPESIPIDRASPTIPVVPTRTSSSQPAGPARSAPEGEFIVQPSIPTQVTQSQPDRGAHTLWRRLRLPIGALLIMTGVAAIGAGWVQMSATSSARQHAQVLLSGGVGGLALLIAGIALLQMHACARQLTGIEERLDHVAASLRALEEVDTASSAPQAARMVAATHASYHDPMCDLLRDQVGIREMLLADARSAGLTACRACLDDLTTSAPAPR